MDMLERSAVVQHHRLAGDDVGGHRAVGDRQVVEGVDAGDQQGEPLEQHVLTRRRSTRVAGAIDLTHLARAERREDLVRTEAGPGG
jgi:hypothetical protein